MVTYRKQVRSKQESHSAIRMEAHPSRAREKRLAVASACEGGNAG